ncbi:DUF309 domain-containing protein [Halobacillus litoralis]|uniref:DUF309 domain-containing protein n=1 Tax=Halobacillus litoralis TaxID=45668 RepID=UPI001CD77F76|nr:DUF309 domain-containing protein [Halobacillus litoralis]MCA0970292.1 DUF309 domain-containing protein [Halobacillus litoralis]
MYPQAYIDYLAHFHGTRDYFECHEVLEEYWKDTDPENRQSPWVFLIQMAVGFYHHRQENFKGAKKLVNRCLLFLDYPDTDLTPLGIDEQRLETLLREELQLVQSLMPYKSPLIPLKDEALQQLVYDRCKEWDVMFGEPSPSEDAIVYKHKLRNQ